MQNTPWAQPKDSFMYSWIPSKEAFIAKYKELWDFKKKLMLELWTNELWHCIGPIPQNLVKTVSFNYYGTEKELVLDDRSSYTRGYYMILCNHPDCVDIAKEFNRIYDLYSDRLEIKKGFIWINDRFLKDYLWSIDNLRRKVDQDDWSHIDYPPLYDYMTLEQTTQQLSDWYDWAMKYIEKYTISWSIEHVLDTMAQLTMQSYREQVHEVILQEKEKLIKALRGVLIDRDENVLSYFQELMTPYEDIASFVDSIKKWERDQERLVLWLLSYCSKVGKKLWPISYYQFTECCQRILGIGWRDDALDADILSQLNKPGDIICFGPIQEAGKLKIREKKIDMGGNLSAPASRN